MTEHDPNQPPRKIDPRQAADLDAWRSSFTAKWQKDVDARLVAAREKSAEVRARLAASSFTASSRDQFATVQVGAAGNLVNVTVSERARNASPVQISQAVMSAYRAAAAQAVAENTAIVRDVAGDKAADQLRELLPEPEQEGV